MNGTFGQYKFTERKKNKDLIVSSIYDTKYEGGKFEIHKECSNAIRMTMNETKIAKKVFAYFENLVFNGFLIGGTFDKSNVLGRIIGTFDNKNDLMALKTIFAHENTIYRIYNDSLGKIRNINSSGKVDFPIEGIEFKFDIDLINNIYLLIRDNNIQERSGDIIRKMTL